jgi:hypothetical protein
LPFEEVRFDLPLWISGKSSAERTSDASLDEWHVYFSKFWQT